MGLVTQQQELPVARYAAKALGTLGRLDLLKQALDASGYESFVKNPMSVQKAALEGMAFLPADRDPLKVLGDLLKLANSAELRRAAADAMVTAIQVMGAA